MKKRILVLLFLSMVVVSSACFATVPQVIGFEGRLTDPSGDPWITPESVVFTIYNNVGASQASSTETINPDSNGVFSALILFPSSAFPGADRWLGINVAGDGEMTPRIQIASAAHAYKALDSDTLGSKSLDNAGTTADRIPYSEGGGKLPYAVLPAIVTSISSLGASQITGAVTFEPGANITLTQSGKKITIASTGTGTVGYATLAGTASTAAYATLAGTATTAASANYATLTGTASNVVNTINISTTGDITADTFTGTFIGSITSANYAILAGTATTAATANYATLAGTATTAASANTAGYATLSGTASNVAYAILSANSSSAAYATLAGSASSAAYATLAGTSTTAATANYATLAGTASTAAYATLSGTATTAGTASYATLTGTASNVAGNINISTTGYITAESIEGTFVGSITNANYATLAGSATSAATASYATLAGTATTAAKAQDLAITGQSQGGILYFNGTNWVTLEPGSNGYVLKTQGASANPTWASGGGTGTVTYVGAGNGLTGGPITGFGTLDVVSAPYATLAGTATSAATAGYATLAGTASSAASVDYATLAGTASSAAYSTLAGTATSAAYATLAGTATTAATAGYATLAGTATSAASAATADYATLAGTATTAASAATAGYATLAGTASSAAYATLAGTATTAATAGYATLAGTASSAASVDYATLAGTATSAASAATADYATLAGTATTAASAATAGYATLAGTATSAASASYATLAGTATTAASAATAGYATLAGTATSAASASYATLAGSATSAASATTADYATLAGTATSAASASTAGYATLAGTATTAGYATLAGTASSAAYSTLAGTASTAAYATLAGSATSAATADYATLAGTATSAASASTADYATLAGSATSAASASYATLSGTATTAGYATLAGTASSAAYSTLAGTASSAAYATLAGTATTAATASNALSLEGYGASHFAALDNTQSFTGINTFQSRTDFNSINVTKIVTAAAFKAGNIVADSASTRVGIGTTEPEVPLHVIGDAIITGKIKGGSPVKVEGGLLVTLGPVTGEGSGLTSIDAGISLVNGSITAAKMAANSVISTAITEDAIGTRELATSNNPTDNKYLRWNLGALEWATPAGGGGGSFEVDGMTIGFNGAGSIEVKNDGITTEKIANGNITAAKLASDAAVLSIAKQGDTRIKGNADLKAGTFITLTQSGQTVEIASTGGAGTVYYVGAGTGLTGGPITGIGTLDVVSAPYATLAGTATSAASATTANYATLAGTATTAATASYATLAGSATSAASASTASYADLAGTATSAASAATANYATLAGTATTAATASYATLAGSATSAASASTANYATLAGTATTAANADKLVGLVPGISATNVATYDANVRVVDSNKLAGYLVGAAAGTVATYDASGRVADSAKLLGATWAAPIGMGTATPSTGAFSSLKTTGSFTMEGNGTFTTGTGAVTLNDSVTINGNTSITGSNTLSVAGLLYVGDLGLQTTNVADLVLNTQGSNISIQTNKNLVMGGSGAFTSGSGAVSLNGRTTVAFNGALTGLTVNQTGAGNIVDFQQNSGSKVTINNSGQLVSSLTTGTAPLTIASTTKVANLNADLLDGYDVGKSAGTIATYDASGRVADSVNWSGKSAPTGDIVGTSDAQTLTSKTIDATSNTLKNISGSALASNIGFTTTGVVTAAAFYGTFEGTYTAEDVKGASFIYPFATAEAGIRIPFNATVTSVEVYCRNGTSVQGLVYNVTQAVNVAAAVTANANTWAVSSSITTPSINANDHIRFSTIAVSGAVTNANILIKYKRRP